MVKPSKIIILGAGITGLSTAYHLQQMIDNQPQLPVDYKIFEKESAVGGLCRSIYQDGFTFDYTGHLLHLREDYAKKLIKKLLKKNYQTHKRNSWIYSKGVFTRYPFQANTYGLPIDVIRQCDKVVSLEAVKQPSYNVAVAGSIVLYDRVYGAR